MESFQAAVELGHSASVQDGAKEFGIHPRDDFNDGNNEGSGFFEVNQSKGMRWSTARGFLRPAIKRPNLRVITQAHTEQLVLDGKTVKGVRFLLNGTRTEARCRREVLLAAGAINSPKILELSGIGQSDRITDLGFTPVHESPGVGENLQDHLQIRTVYKVKNAMTLNTMANSLLGKAKMGLQFLTTQSGAVIHGA